MLPCSFVRTNPLANNAKSAYIWRTMCLCALETNLMEEEHEPPLAVGAREPVVPTGWKS
jgi:hypothetical protein